MPPRPNWSFRLRRGWRAFVEGQTFSRRPVSVTRQRIGTLALLIMVLAFGAYVWSTRADNIRRRAIAFIERAVPGDVQVRIGSASFGMFDGITLHDVEIATPFDERLNAAAHDIGDRYIFYARSLKLTHNPWHLLTGRLQVDHVLAVRPSIYLSQNVRTGVRNWQLLHGEVKAPSKLATPHRPRITIRDAQLVVTAIDPEGERIREIEKLDADIRPHPASDTGYFIELRRYTNPVERATVFFDPGEGVIANAPFVAGRMISLQLPPAARRLFQDIALVGEARLARMTFASPAEQQRNLEVELRNVQCSIPVWLLGKAEDATTRPAQATGELHGSERLVRMVGARGHLKLRGDDADIDLAGLFNGAQCRFSGTIRNIDGGLGGCGFNIRFKADGLPMPEADVREAFVTNEHIPWELRRLFFDYDPHGPFDFDLLFSREPAAPESLSVRGDIRPRGGSVCVRWFPFTVDTLDGIIRIEGRDVYLDQLGGRHGSGYLTANASFDTRYDYARVDLDVKATAVPLDAHLYLAMPDRYQAAWRLFRPQGTAHIHTRMQRAPASDEEGRPPWIKQITIDLVDAQAALPPYPYPIENLCGRLEVDEDRILIQGLTGTCRGSSVRIDGYAIIDEDDAPEIELRIEGEGLRLDDTFARSLPEEGRGAVVQFQPDGFADVIGSISMHGDGNAVWDLRARVRDTSIVYDQFPYRLDDVEGEIDVSPDRVSILNLIGKRDQTQLKASGDVQRTGDGTAIDVAFDAIDVDLNEGLYAALPAGLRDVWDLLKPSGRVRIRTGLQVFTEGGSDAVRHRTDIEPLGAALTFAEFPLPLTAVTGKVSVTGRRIEILTLAGKCFGGSVALNGSVDLTDFGRHGALEIRLSDMPFNRRLLDALPPALSKFLKSLEPGGRFDITLSPIRFEEDDRGRMRWNFDAELTLRRARVNLGFKVTEADGRITARCEIDEKGEFHVESGELSLASVVMAGWELKDLSARLKTSQIVEDGRRRRFIEVRDAAARFYGGEAVGFASAELGGRRPEYEANITIRDAQLGEYLAAQHRRTTAERPPGMPPSAAPAMPTESGSVDGRLNLYGRSGIGSFREGNGELFVSRAQVWKLPLILAIFQVLNLTPDENVFHDGRLGFSLRDDRMTLQTIDLQGKAMSFVGSGTIDLATDEMDITLLAGSPVRIRVPVLTEFLEGASREIMEIRVTGTPSKPEIMPQPLKSLTKALKTIFPEAPPAREKNPPALRPGE